MDVMAVKAVLESYIAGMYRDAFEITLRPTTSSWTSAEHITTLSMTLTLSN